MIDNCEHVISDAATVVQKLLRQCRSLTVLATSREPLGHSAALVYRLSSMDSKTASELFVARVQHSDSMWSADPQRLAVIVDICKTLDGIPLAIELAASRVASLGLEAVRSRLKGGITLIGSPDLPSRHLTMTATIAWSYDLLNEAEAELFRRLSVVTGGFTLELAENIAYGTALPIETIADVLSELVRKSLINVNHLGTSTRYGFLDTIRTFASQRLTEAGDREKDSVVENTMLRLMEWLTQKAAVLDSGKLTPVLTELRSELENTAAAIGWAVSNGGGLTVASASRLFVAFRFVWAGTSRQMEFRELGLRLLDCLSDDEAPELVGLVIFALSPYLGEAKLLSLCQRAIPLLTATGHRERAGGLHGRCAQVECLRGDVQAAERHLQLGQELFSCDELKHTRGGWTFAVNAGYVRCFLRDFEAARALLIGLEIPPGDTQNTDAQRLRASIEFHTGNVGTAIELLSSVKKGLDAHPLSNWHMFQTCGTLAEYYLYRGDIPAAEIELRACLNAALEARTAFMAVVASYARHAALVAARTNRIELAVRLLGAADPHHLAEPGAPFDSGGVATKIVEAELSPTRVEALRRESASADLYELFEVFLAQPTATESAFQSSTSSMRPTAVTRSSPN